MSGKDSELHVGSHVMSEGKVWEVISVPWYLCAGRWIISVRGSGIETTKDLSACVLLPNSMVFVNGSHA